MMTLRLVLPAMLLCACNPPSPPSQPPMPPVTPQVTQQVSEPPGGGSPAAASPAAPTRSADAVQAIPAVFHGRWDASLAACQSASEMRLTVERTTLRFWESHGDVLSVAAASPQAATVHLAMSGEGETWTRDIEMALTDDGALALDGVKRVRCP